MKAMTLPPAPRVCPRWDHAGDVAAAILSAFPQNPQRPDSVVDDAIERAEAAEESDEHPPGDDYERSYGHGDLY